MEVVESIVLVRLVPGVPRMIIDGEGKSLKRRGEVVKIERLLVGLTGASGKVIGCAQCGILISTCLGLEPLEFDEAKDWFGPGSEKSGAVGEP